jgi:hypothetical protein
MKGPNPSEPAEILSLYCHLSFRSHIISIPKTIKSKKYIKEEGSEIYHNRDIAEYYVTAV